MQGDNDYQTPLWIRPNSLKGNQWGSYRQVVGHTRLEEIFIGKIIYTDAKMKQYLIIDTETQEHKVYQI